MFLKKCRAYNLTQYTGHLSYLWDFCDIQYLPLFRLEPNTSKLVVLYDKWVLFGGGGQVTLNLYVVINIWTLQITLYTSDFNFDKQKYNLQKWKQSLASLRFFPKEKH